MFCASLLLPCFLVVAYALPSINNAPREWDGVTNLLVPNPDGVLEFATPAHLAARAALASTPNLQKRDGCSDQIFTGADAQTCYQFCERAVSDVYGEIQKVSADINCTVGDVCDVQHVESVTITNGFSITLGGMSGPGEEGAATISGSVSYQWSKAETTSNAFTFHPKNGDVGYIGFRPKMKESRGAFQVYTHWESSDGFEVVCETPVVSEDDNASGRSPVQVGGFADGQFTFCSSATGSGC